MSYDMVLFGARPPFRTHVLLGLVCFWAANTLQAAPADACTELSLRVREKIAVMPLK